MIFLLFLPLLMAFARAYHSSQSLLLNVGQTVKLGLIKYESLPISLLGRFQRHILVYCLAVK